VSPRRRYRLGKREASVARTRARILEAARAVLVHADFRGLSLDEVARTAGVTRVTIYNQFGTKVGLIEELFRDSGRRMKVLQVLAAFAQPDPRDALHALIRGNCRAWSRDRRVLQRVIALTVLDPAARRVLAYFEGRRRHDIEVLVARLAAARMLASRVAPARVTSAVLALTSFQLYDQLVTMGVAHAAIVELLTRMAGAFLAPKRR
jgi:AcrR family transcriptional regulator